MAEIRLRPARPGEAALLTELALRSKGYWGCDQAFLDSRLWQHAMATARQAGFVTLRIGADPGAEGFYRAMGAQRIGATPSGSIPGRTLPLLQMQVPPSGQAFT